MRPDQQIKTTLVLALALGATTAPVALAYAPQASWVVRPNPDQQAIQLIPTATVPPQRSPLVRPNPDEQGTQLAQAVAPQSSETVSVVQPNPDQQAPLAVPATIVRVTNPNGSFDWGDAGIGAAAGVALSMLALGLGFLVSQLRTRHAKRSAAIAS